MYTNPPSPVPCIDTIDDFFKLCGISLPYQPAFVCINIGDHREPKFKQMPLYRINFFRITHCFEPPLDTTKDTASERTNRIWFSFPGKLESWNYAPIPYGYALYFTATFAGLDITDPHFSNAYPYFDFEAVPSLLLNSSDSKVLKTIADEMIEESQSLRADKWDMVRGLLQVYLSKVRRFHQQQINPASVVDINVTQSLFNRFRNELNSYFRDLDTQTYVVMPTVSNIAKRLNINANYLSNAIKKTTGRTASSYIQAKLMQEATMYLLHTDLRISEVAYKLGFEYVSYFNQFFKKHSHYAPVKYRRLFKK